MVREVVLAADLGSGSLRVGAVTAKGKVVAAASTALPAAERAGAGTAVDAAAWWRALNRTVGRTLLQLPKGDHVRGVCLSGMTRSQVLLDREGSPLAALEQLLERGVIGRQDSVVLFNTGGALKYLDVLQGR